MKHTARIPPLAKSSRIDYSYVILAVASLSTFFSAPGQTFFISGFTDIYVEQLGLSRSLVSGMYSAGTLLSGLIIFSMGRMADRFGARRMNILSAVLLGAVCLFNSFHVNFVTLFIGFFAARYFGQGAMSMLPSIFVPRWFHKKRAMAFAALQIGGTAASTLVPLINLGLTGLVGWRGTWRVWGGLLWLVFVPIAAIFLINRPSDIGLAPIGSEKQPGKTPDEDSGSFTLRQAVGTFAFWGMLFCQIILPLTGTGIVFHLISIFEAGGMPAASGSIYLSIISIASFVMVLLSGKLLERIKPNVFSAIFCAAELVALLLLIVARSTPVALVFAVLHGCATGMFTVCNGFVWPDYFGTRHLGDIRGVTMMGSVICSAIGPLPLGILYDLTGSYTTALLLLAALPAAGLIVAALVRRPRLRQPSPSPPGKG